VQSRAGTLTGGTTSRNAAAKHSSAQSDITAMGCMRAYVGDGVRETNPPARRRHSCSDKSRMWHTRLELPRGSLLKPSAHSAGVLALTKRPEHGRTTEQ